MKIVLKILQWIISLFILLTALSFIDTKAGFVLAASGAVVLPPITKRIPRFRFKKLLLIALSVVLFGVGMSMTPDVPTNTVNESAETVSDEITEEKGEAEEKKTAEEKKVAQEEKAAGENKTAKTKKAAQENKAPETEKAAAPSKKELINWMDEYLESDKVIYKASKCKQWRKYSEDAFLPVWKKAVSEKMAKLSDISAATDYVYHAERIYKCIYEDSTRIDNITKARAKVSKAITTAENIKDSYSNIDFDKAFAEARYEKFYITQRLEKNYSTSILGDIDKAIDKYTADGSMWVAYNVEYFYGNAAAGDTRYIISSNELNPFSQTGEYEIYCYNTGGYQQVRDSKGFVSDAPIFHMIEEPDDFQNECIEYNNAINLADLEFEKLIDCLTK